MGPIGLMGLMGQVQVPIVGLGRVTAQIEHEDEDDEGGPRPTSDPGDRRHLAVHPLEN
jgi:hypothetical protein